MSENEIEQSEVLLANAGERKFNACGREVIIAWKFANDGGTLSGFLHTQNSQYRLPIELGLKAPHRNELIYRIEAIDVQLWLKQMQEGQVHLYCRLPLTRNEFFEGAIGRWQADEPEPDLQGGRP